MLLPLSWWDMFPHQLAHSNEDAWARGLQVLSKHLSLFIFKDSNDCKLSLGQCYVCKHSLQLWLDKWQWTLHKLRP